jgi:hypothetical protein
MPSTIHTQQGITYRQPIAHRCATCPCPASRSFLRCTPATTHDFLSFRALARPTLQTRGHLEKAYKHATATHHGRHSEVIADCHHDLHDLGRQLPRGSQDERLAIPVAQVDVLQQACHMITTTARENNSQRSTCNSSHYSMDGAMGGVGHGQTILPMVNVAVLPVPDCACAMVSRIIRRGLIARCWIADGFSKPYE